MKNIIRRLLKAKTFLKFIVLYLTVVLLFTCLYSIIPDQFYSSTSKQEYLLDKEADQIEIQLQRSINENFKEYYRYDSIFLDTDGEWLFNIENMKVNKLLREGHFTFEVLLYVTNVSEKITGKEGESLPQYHTSLKMFMYDDMISSGGRIYRFGEIQSREINPNMLDIDTLDFAQIFYLEGSDVPPEIIGIRIPARLNERINTFSNNVNDFSYEQQGNFFRMLYLSMVTITTLGYGDIVPLTNSARILIGMEATIGIIIMGLFVNRILKS